MPIAQLELKQVKKVINLKPQETTTPNEKSSQQLFASSDLKLELQSALTPAAKSWLKKAGIDSTKLESHPQDITQLESQTKIIDLINRMTQDRSDIADPSYDQLFDATTQLTKSAVNAYETGNVERSLAITDVCDQTLDWMATLANNDTYDSFINPDKDVTLGQAFAKGAVHSVEKRIDGLQHIVKNPQETFKSLAKDIVSFAHDCGLAENVGSQNIPAIESIGWTAKDLTKSLQDTTQRIKDMSILEKSEMAGEVVGGLVTDYIIWEGTLKTVDAVAQKAVNTALLKRTGTTSALTQTEAELIKAGNELTLTIDVKSAELAQVMTKEMQNLAPSIEKYFFPAIHEQSIASSSLQGAQLKEHLYQLEEYGKCGFKMLENGRIRYYGIIQPSNKPGAMAGRRKVREWAPSTFAKKTWMETLDHQANIRIIRVQVDGPKVHYVFDGNGNFTGIR